MKSPTVVIIAAAVLIQLAVAAGIVTAIILPGGEEVEAQQLREYNLEIQPADVDYGEGNVWHAWTFNGTVPGPTLTVTVGETLRVHVKNNLDLVHSFHTHLTNYDMESDGSQLNVISGQGAGAMIPPGGEWTYEFQPTEPGLYYYHCHSADGGLTISQHIHQGLYGAIIVKSPEDPLVRDEVLFMSEKGSETEGDNIPPFIMNGLGFPGGEHHLEAVFHEQGIDAVTAQFNKTVPTFEAKVGEEIRLHVVNMGDQIHTFHAHNVAHVSEQALPNQIWPGNVLPLLPGAVDTLRLTFTKPGLWLFHCHVVSHADAGMIGLFIIEEEGQPPPQ
jgi:FtsP/CotA-like multicopper oxidase with cupredoxin domain